MLDNGITSPNFNSYLSVEDADHLMSTSVYSGEWQELQKEDKERALITASLMIDSSYTFKGSKFDPNQPLEFPRRGVYEGDSTTATIPHPLKYAVLHYAHYLSLNPSDGLSSSKTEGIKSIKVSSIEVELNTNYTQTSIPSFITGFLRSLIVSHEGVGNSGSNSGYVRVKRS